MKNTHFFSKKVFIKDKCMVFYAVASILCLFFTLIVITCFSMPDWENKGRVLGEEWDCCEGMRKGSKNVEIVLKILKNVLLP